MTEFTVKLELNGFQFSELFDADGLGKLDQAFLKHLASADNDLCQQLLDYRKGSELSAKQMSTLLIDSAIILDDFLAKLFNIETQVNALQIATLSHDPIFLFKQQFVLKRAKRKLNKIDELDSFIFLNQSLISMLESKNLSLNDMELAVSQYASQLLEHPENNQTEIDQLTDWCVLAMLTPEGQEVVKGWSSFCLPKKLNYENLVEIERIADDPAGRMQASPKTWRQRDGFDLTDQRMNARKVQNEIHYCVYCHKNEGDFCSKGFPVKKGKPEQGLKINPVGETLTGCPLEEKISEMHMLKKQGLAIAALAMVMVDNPMCPATGHRICNDCMKACIYQKQEPVNIPEVETRILTDILDLPWGVEIYDLLTRWNPLRQKQYLLKPYNGMKILVMGMGPAGFSLAHHLLMEGFAVVGADGLKLEPLPRELIEQPIRDFNHLKERLSTRVMTGFGGVAEYGITVRWDKNFLKLIYITLMRRQYFQVFGSIRFGGTLTVEDAWEQGFDHVAVAVGAGLPKELPIPNSMAPGMRQANDFLMALQLTGAAKSSSLANLQIRLPAVIIGGGLTGIDTATEVQAYYIVQVEKITKRYQTLIDHYGESSVREKFSSSELEILDEWLLHGELVQTERERAKASGTEPNFIELLRRWGGVTIAYRRSMQESPAYKRNHEEVNKALEEGIYYAEGLEPIAVILDEIGQVKALRCHWKVLDEASDWHATDEEQVLPARSIFVATGAKPNVAYEFEHEGSFHRQRFEYMRYELIENKLQQLETKGHIKALHFGAFTSYEQDQHRVTFLGDTHPVFHGSVVKAIASAQRVYPEIVSALKPGDNPANLKAQQAYQSFKEKMETLFRAHVISVDRHSSNVLELTVHAPMAAAKFKPGQFYRLQNYERLGAKIKDTRLQTEALALLGIKKVDQPQQLSFMVFEQGVSSRLVADLQVGQRISVMGPTGVRTKVVEGDESILIVGGMYAIAYLFSAAPAMRAAGNRVVFVGYFEGGEQAYCREQVEALADETLWINESGAVKKDLTKVLKKSANQLNIYNISRVMTIGSSQLLKTVQQARHQEWKSIFNSETKFIGSVYGPMQCMLKGVCAQCLQWQIDPATGKRTKAVYACSWQHQPMELIDMGNIDDRLGQNRVQEIFSGLWLDYLKHATG